MGQVALSDIQLKKGGPFLPTLSNGSSWAGLCTVDPQQRARGRQIWSRKVQLDLKKIAHRN